MSPERWHRLNELFHAALEQPPSQTGEFVQAACGDDRELYAELVGMLREHARSGFLDDSLWHDSPAAPDPAFRSGDLVAERYVIRRYINRGGMGEVYEAEDLELHETVALKTLRPAIAGDENMISRFKRELQLARKISHPNICRLFDVARHGSPAQMAENTYVLTMEYLPGLTLAEKLQQDGPFSAANVLPIVRQVASGLDAAHDLGILHRDLKPSNIMLVPAGETVRAVITDFGLARTVTGTADQTSRVMGTFEYMAPELFTGTPASPASDVYALGVVIRKMLAGRQLSRRWSRALQRALHPSPGERFARAGDLVGALEGRTAFTGLLRPHHSARPTVLGGFLVLVAVLSGAGAWRYFAGRRQLPPEALRLYEKGVGDIGAGAYFAATKELARAVAVAPTFAMGHVRLAEAWAELQVPEKAKTEMLLARRDDFSKLSAQDRLQVEAIDLTITREYEAALAKREELSRQAPDRFAVDLGRAYERSNRSADAIRTYHRAAAAPSDNPAAWLRLGVLYSRNGSPGEALAAFARADELYQADNNLEGLVELEYQRGIDANRRKQYAEAAAFLSRAMDMARTAGNPQQEIRAELQLATTAAALGDGAKSEQYAQEAAATAHSHQMDVLATEGLINLGNALARQRKFDAAEGYYNEAMTAARRDSAYRLTALSLLSLAALHDLTRKPGEMFSEATEALRFFQSNNGALESVQCLTLIGRYYRDRGDLANALAAIQKSLDIAEKSGLRASVALAHESVGSILVAEERYPEALPHYEANLELTPAADQEHRAYAALQSGDVLRILGRFEEARARFEVADRAAANLPSLHLKVLRARAALAFSEGQAQVAVQTARRALAADPKSLLPADRTALTDLLCEALPASAATERRRVCEQAVNSSVTLEDVAEHVRSRLAMARALLDQSNASGALPLLKEIQADVADRPESRWRALALLARAGAPVAQEARQSLESLRTLWGDANFQRYLGRSEIRELSRPLSTNFAK